MGRCIGEENIGLLLALIDGVCENKGAAIYYPPDIEHINPHLEIHLETCLSHTGVIGTAPEYYGHQRRYSDQQLNETIYCQPNVDLPDAVYGPRAPENCLQEYDIPCQDDMQS